MSRDSTGRRRLSENSLRRERKFSLESENVTRSTGGGVHRACVQNNVQTYRTFDLMRESKVSLEHVHNYDGEVYPIESKINKRDNPRDFNEASKLLLNFF